MNHEMILARLCGFVVCDAGSFVSSTFFLYKLFNPVFENMRCYAWAAFTAL